MVTKKLTPWQKAWADLEDKRNALAQAALDYAKQSEICKKLLDKQKRG